MMHKFFITRDVETVSVFRSVDLGLNVMYNDMMSAMESFLRMDDNLVEPDPPEPADYAHPTVPESEDEDEYNILSYLEAIRHGLSQDASLNNIFSHMPTPRNNIKVWVDIIGKEDKVIDEGVVDLDDRTLEEIRKSMEVASVDDDVPESAVCTATMFMSKRIEYVPTSSCSICLERDSIITSMDCGHRFGCFECSMKIESCPICRSPMTCLLKRSSPKSANCEIGVAALAIEPNLEGSVPRHTDLSTDLMTQEPVVSPTTGENLSYDPSEDEDHESEPRRRRRRRRRRRNNAQTTETQNQTHERSVSPWRILVRERAIATRLRRRSQRMTHNQT